MTTTDSDEALVKGLCEITLETGDPAAVEAFYTTALGLRVLSRDNDRVWLACGRGARLGLWTPGAKEFGDEGGRHVHFALSVTSAGLDVSSRRLRALGIEFRGPAQHPGGDRSLYLEDPAGNMVELWDLASRHGLAEEASAFAAADE